MQLADIARALGCELRGDGAVEIVDVAAIDDARPATLTFVADPRHASKLATSRAAAVILPRDAPPVRLPALLAPHPYLAFIGAIELFHPPVRGTAPGVHPAAVIGDGTTLGPGTSIGPHAVVGRNVTIGRDAVLHPNVTIYDRVRIGDGFTAHAGVVVREGVEIGDRVTLHAGVVLGSDGFGYLPLPDGNRKIPHIGTVVIEDDVEIGANATIDRAALGATVVGRGSKLDNLVMVGYGCRIGPGCLLAGQVGLGGSTVLGARVMMGGQAGAAGHLTIGDGAQIAAQTGIHRAIPARAQYSGSPAIEGGVWRRVTAAFPRLPELFRRVRRLEQRVGVSPDEPGDE